MFAQPAARWTVANHHQAGAWNGRNLNESPYLFLGRQPTDVPNDQ